MDKRNPRPDGPAKTSTPPRLTARDAGEVADELDVLHAEATAKMHDAARRVTEAQQRASDPALAKADSHAFALTGGVVGELTGREMTARAELEKAMPAFAASMRNTDPEPLPDDVAANALDARARLADARDGATAVWQKLRRDPTYVAAQREARDTSWKAIVDGREAIADLQAAGALSRELEVRRSQVRHVDHQMQIRGQRGTVMAPEAPAADLPLEQKVEPYRAIVLPEGFRPEATPDFTFDTSPGAAPPKFIGAGG